MDSMEEQISGILNNPEAMSKIMQIAQSLGTSGPKPEQEKPQPPLPDIDLGMLQKFSGLARQGNIDAQQQNLLQALNPYLSRERIRKLENAMRAAKMAKVAAAFLGPQGLKLPTAR